MPGITDARRVALTEEDAALAAIAAAASNDDSGFKLAMRLPSFDVKYVDPVRAWRRAERGVAHLTDRSWVTPFCTGGQGEGAWST